MALFDHTGDKLAAGPTLLLAADPGDAVVETARRYDPRLRAWHGRLVFGNGVLLFGPVTVTPKLTEQAGLPAGAAVAWYAAAALQSHRDRVPHESKQADGESLVIGLAARLGGSVHPWPPLREPALAASVYSERPLDPDEVLRVLRPYAGADVGVEDAKDGTYAISGKHAAFLTAYWPPRLYTASFGPPALGAMRNGPLHHWDLNTGIRSAAAHQELRQKVASGALALAMAAGGVAVDMCGFRFEAPEELRPVSA